MTRRPFPIFHVNPLCPTYDLIEHWAGHLHAAAGHSSAFDCRQWAKHRADAERAFGLPLREAEWPIMVCATGSAQIKCVPCGTELQSGTAMALTADAITALVHAHLPDCLAITNPEKYLESIGAS